VAIGLFFLLLGILVGLASPIGVLVGLVGGVISFTGVVLGGDVVMPVALRLVGRMLGRSAPARLAAENALRHPQRSARTTIGLVIGVTLLMTFGVAMLSFEQMVYSAQDGRELDPAQVEATRQMITAIVAVFSILIGFSGVIAGVGLVNNLSLSVLQRTRELGLLRALGFSVRQLRRMILTESAQLTATALLLGLVLGAFYGWAGAQAMLGSIAGFVLPTIPWLIVLIVAVAAVALTAIASWAPTRRATRVSPITALAVE
jgi:putative ABC transport system permease protein